MIIQYRMLALLCLSALLASPFAMANWRALDQTAMGEFTPEDLDLFIETGREALEDAADGEERAWENPETGAHGTIRPLTTQQIDGANCRRTEIFNSAEGYEGTSEFLFCRQPDGSWKVVSE